MGVQDDDPNPELEFVDPQADRAHGGDRSTGVQRRVCLGEPGPAEAGRKRCSQQSMAVHANRGHYHRLHQEARLNKRIAAPVPF